MKTLLLLLGLLLLVCWAYARAKGRPAASPHPLASTEAFELHVGGQVYEIRLDEPVTVVTPGGEEVEVVLRRKEVLHYAGDGLAFDYPAALQLGRETEGGITTLTLEGTASPFVLIQIYPSSNTPEEVLGNLLEAFENEYRARQAQFLNGNGRSVERTVGGTTRRGRVLAFRLGGQQIRTELYAFPHHDAVVALILQQDVEEAALAEDYFAVITRSLR
ncbi:hypothetical protein GQ464_009295 [Rhodocaloribacter litoris]|uniref:hypothetical protein n=1 Tax=Rhodocaloribacter litoris TaxID=2558931 RepID=UPI00141E541D|nr:hypothetical protein [Rhodocaloribacter litoris]QXD17102.1 hypothetical protein GQ464_009295 [Rhodocaloribacter litoris]